jgi:hypothetical protein
VAKRHMEPPHTGRVGTTIEFGPGGVRSKALHGVLDTEWNLQSISKSKAFWVGGQAD